LVLGIETSCDDTSVALVDPDGAVVAAATASQAAIHTRYGGVYPEMASRAHVEKILPTVRMVLEDSGVNPRELDAIGVTRGPGLIGSLMVGVNTAVGLGQAWDVPVLGINHLRGHLRSADLEERRLSYPALILLVSGGHTLIAHMTSPGEITLVSTTVDDSVGEAYDKIARMLGLGYPGGPLVDRLALDGRPTIPFPRPMLRDGLNFSFSGLKESVRQYLARVGPDVVPADVAASFVAACMEVLVTKCRRALAEYPAECLAVVGGVAASPQLREAATELCAATGVRLCLPPLRWSTDNGAMIAMATWDYLANDVAPSPLAQSSLTIEAF
jgi:N6-L-threonylcarbamoyladenine synthase